jgi:hypothetical protein
VNGSRGDISGSRLLFEHTLIPRAEVANIMRWYATLQSGSPRVLPRAVNDRRKLYPAPIDRSSQILYRP